MLTVVFRIPLPIAIGTGLAQMIGTATVSLLRHRSLRQGEPRFDVLMLGGSAIGAAAGAQAVEWLQSRGSIELPMGTIALSTAVLYSAYLLFLAMTAWSLWHRVSTGVERLDYVRRGPLARVALPPLLDLPRLPLTRVSALVIAYVGLAMGFLSGLLGVGGGIALMPIMLYGFGFPMRQAAGTGIIVLLVTAIAGTVVHARAGHVHLQLAMVLLVGAGITAQIGVRLTHRLSASLLRKALVGVILATMIAIAWDVARQLH
jgi:uncharacterized membrane protein YfcA